MPIIVNLDVMMAKRKISLGELAERIDLTPANLSILKQEKPKPYASPLWRLSAKNWTASRETYWNTEWKTNFTLTMKCIYLKNFIPDRCILLLFILS